MKRYFKTIYTVPIPKARPRFTRSGHSYTPAKTRSYESLIRGEYDGEKFDGAIGVAIVFAFEIPKSAKKSVREKMLACEILPTKRPDTDNLIKAVTDALNGLAYEDDSQIVYISGQKTYASEPYVQIGIWEIGEDL